MGKKKRIGSLGLVALLLCLALAPFSAAAAAGEPAFKLTLSPEKPVAGGQATVTITGENMTDLYGFELNVAYDPKLLKYVKTVSPIAGFSVPKADVSGKLMFAHVKIGKEAGDNGTVQLATVTFDVLGDAAAAAKLSLGDVKLVKSDLTSVTLKAGAELTLPISAKTVAAIAFKDIAGHWAKTSIEKAAALGIIMGYDDSTFRPQAKVTRAEFTAMITRAFALKPTNGITPKFADAAKIPSWASTYIAEAAAAGVVSGYADGSFRPDQLITRAEMAAIIVRAAGIATDPAAQPTFADANQIAAWAKPGVAAAVNAGIVKGSAGNRFSPLAQASRAEAAVMLVGAVEYTKATK
ncbi:S-layer homology domain-containing protein [Paenibacillus xanthanilyticus]|uniref:S-layer homology domain-containing protein n=1 Tax=Paenibacillus xanthanilyticus TaxID=1783531 RepID=A0ABV8KB18_9BACL